MSHCTDTDTTHKEPGWLLGWLLRWHPWMASFVLPSAVLSVYNEGKTSGTGVNDDM